jgi:hypothetical protein
MVCDDKTRLTMEYHDATKKISKCVTDLNKRMGNSSKEEYERLQHASEEGRVHSEEARLALEKHLAAHGC